MSAIDAGINVIVQQLGALPLDRRQDFARRYEALHGAGAEFLDSAPGDGKTLGVIGADLRRLCAEFGIIV
jgi:hypothetical protein